MDTGMVAELVKVTDLQGMSKNLTRWGEGVRHRIAPEKRAAILCGPGVLHAYRTLDVATLLIPAHLGLSLNQAQAWTAEGVVVVDDGTKVGCHYLETLRRVGWPAWTRDAMTYRRVACLFAGLCAEAVLPIFEERSPDDKRPRDAVELVLKMARTGQFDKAAATDAARAATDAATDAADAAWAAAWAATDAARAATDAMRSAVRSAAWAADAAWAAAWAATDAAWAAEAGKIDAVALAAQAVRDITGSAFVPAG